MAFTAKDVADLRAKTGCGMMDCKKALSAAEGDIEKAVDILREQGLAASAKKASRIAAEGTVYAFVDTAKKIGVVVEVNAETDFVAKNADFNAFVATVANTILEANPADVEALAEVKAVDTEQTVAELLREKILTIGENIKLRRFVRYEGALASYIHGGGKIGVLVKFDTTDEVASKPEFAEFGKNVAMHIAAAYPQYLNEAEVPADVVEKEKTIYAEQLANDPANAKKPANIIEKIVTGRIAKFFKEICLVEQVYVKDNELTINKYVEKTAKELGGDIAIASFVRFEKGEGIEKREDDFAAEVAGMIK
ncbi:MAG: translation elongation factor Ts [Oscillospiraceae bacterium]|jgi:elongation factor Ts|nr:translation elongation factor Ts [Oscillospiraceae bacterium]